MLYCNRCSADFDPSAFDTYVRVERGEMMKNIELHLSGIPGLRCLEGDVLASLESRTPPVGAALYFCVPLSVIP